MVKQILDGDGVILLLLTSLTYMKKSEGVLTNLAYGIQWEIGYQTNGIWTWESKAWVSILCISSNNSIGNCQNVLRHFTCFQMIQIFVIMRFCVNRQYINKKGFLSFGHLKTKLNNFLSFNFFSILQIALASKTPYAIVLQISEQLNKTSNLMHRYYQSGFFAGFFEFFHLRTKLLLIFFSCANCIN